MRTPLRRYARGDELITLDEVQQNRSRVYSFDHQGTTQCLTDETGAVTDRFAADACGVQVKRTGTSINREWYIGSLGQRTDSGNYHYSRSRYLAPSLGAWLSAEAWYRPELRYGYVRNSPALRRDPSGRITVSPAVPTWWQLPRATGDQVTCCGKRCVYWFFKLGKKAAKDGWLIQKVTQTIIIESCDPNKPSPPPTKEVFWEAFRVFGDDDVFMENRSGGSPWTDKSEFEANAETRGYQLSEGELRFFLEEAGSVGDLKFEWFNHRSPSAGRLTPSTTDPAEAAFWDQNKHVQAEAAAFRSAQSIWNCCKPACKDNDSRTTVATASPRPASVATNCSSDPCRRE
jgi:hypothetical protein